MLVEYAETIRLYYKYQYNVEICFESENPWLSIPYSLSTATKPFENVEVSAVRTENVPPDMTSHFGTFFAMFNTLVKRLANEENTEINLNDLSKHVKELEQEMKHCKGHFVQSVNQDKHRDELMEQLKQNKSKLFCVQVSTGNKTPFFLIAIRPPSPSFENPVTFGRVLLSVVTCKSEKQIGFRVSMKIILHSLKKGLKLGVFFTLSQ